MDANELAVSLDRMTRVATGVIGEPVNVCACNDRPGAWGSVAWRGGGFVIDLNRELWRPGSPGPSLGKIFCHELAHLMRGHPQRREIKAGAFLPPPGRRREPANAYEQIVYTAMDAKEAEAQKLAAALYDRSWRWHRSRGQSFEAWIAGKDTGPFESWLHGG